MRAKLEDVVHNICVKADWHRQTAIDRLVSLGRDYRTASSMVAAEFDRVALVRDDDGDGE